MEAKNKRNYIGLINQNPIGAAGNRGKFAYSFENFL